MQRGRTRGATAALVIASLNVALVIFYTGSSNETAIQAVYHPATQPRALFRSMPSSSQEAAAFNATVANLAQTELQLVTWRGDIYILPFFWHALAHFLPTIKGVTIIYEKEDDKVLAGSMPPASFPFPVKRVIIQPKSKFNLQPGDATKCKFAQEPDGMNRLGYVRQQVYNMFADELSQFDPVYILLIDSDAPLIGFRWLAGTLFNEVGLPSYKTVPYSELGADAPQKRIYKPGIDTLLKVDNQIEFMTCLPVVIKKEVFEGFRAAATANTGYGSLIELLQVAYVDNRICSDGLESAMQTYGVMSNFNWLLAYIYYYAPTMGEFPKSGKCDGKHMGGEKRTAISNKDFNHYGQQYGKYVQEYLQCEEWYCFAGNASAAWV